MMTKIDPLPNAQESEFCRRLQGCNRILEHPDYFIWGCSPIDGPDSKTHVFYSRWPKEFGMEGWLEHSEIAHAVADQPEGPYETVDVVLKGRGQGLWNGVTIHNPTIHKVGDQYALFYVGNSNNQLETKRTGLLLSDSLYGPWEQVGDGPILQTGEPGAWDDFVTSNPAMLQHPNGQFWLYYKSWDRAQFDDDVANAKVHAEYGIPILGNRKYGLAIADDIKGPYNKCPQNPIVDYSPLGDNKQCEDATVWHEDGQFNMIIRDMGFFNHDYGLLLTSDDGISWSDPTIAFYGAKEYFNEPTQDLTRQGRFERPQILMRNNKPAYLFVAYRGGKYNTASGAVLKIS